MQQLHVFCALSKDGEALTSKVFKDDGRFIVKLWADDYMILSRSYPFNDFPTDHFPLFAAWEMVNA